jgi:hypothetical protein
LVSISVFDGTRAGALFQKASNDGHVSLVYRHETAALPVDIARALAQTHSANMPGGGMLMRATSNNGFLVIRRMQISVQVEAGTLESGL